MSEDNILLPQKEVDLEKLQAPPKQPFWLRQRSASKPSKATEEGRNLKAKEAAGTKQPCTARRHPMEVQIALVKPVPNFLPSEAHKVGTPPLIAKGFLFDTGKAIPKFDWGHTEKEPSPRDDCVLGAEREWFRIQESDLKDEINEEEPDPDIAEHLQTSPLCPTNLKHSSGGIGVCHYHRRNDEWR